MTGVLSKSVQRRLAAQNEVRIYELDRGYSIWCWLCSKCLAHKKANGWEVKQSKDPPHPLACDDCNNPVRELEVPF